MGVAFDFNGNVDPAALVAAGGVVALIYRSNSGHATALHAAGLGVVLIDETTGTDAEGGFAEGQARARAANTWMLAAGYPTTCEPVVVLWDTDNNADPDPNAVADAVAFAHGYDSVTVFAHWTGYGPRKIINGIRAAGSKMRLSWVPETWGADPNLDALIQVVNTPSPVAGTDLDRMYAIDVGQWPRPGAPPISQEDDEMRPTIVSSNPGVVPAVKLWQERVGNDTVLVQGPPIPWAALGELSGEAFLGSLGVPNMAAMNNGQPFAVDATWLASVPAAPVAPTAIDPNALATAIAAKLPPSSGVTAAQIESACEQAVRAVLHDA